MSELGAQALLANAYHLFLQPGADIVEEAGGLGRFMNWPGPTFTDSGGFQVLSLGAGFKKTLAMDSTGVTSDDVIAPTAVGDYVHRELPGSTLVQLAATGHANYISPDRSLESFGHITATTGTDLVRTQSSGSLLGLLPTTYQLDGKNIGIAILDSGMDTQHQSFRSALLQSMRSNEPLSGDFKAV